MQANSGSHLKPFKRTRATDGNHCVNELYTQSYQTYPSTRGRKEGLEGFDTSARSSSAHTWSICHAEQDSILLLLLLWFCALHIRPFALARLCSLYTPRLLLFRCGVATPRASCGACRMKRHDFGPTFYVIHAQNACNCRREAHCSVRN